MCPKCFFCVTWLPVETGSCEQVCDMQRQVPRVWHWQHHKTVWSCSRPPTCWQGLSPWTTESLMPLLPEVRCWRPSWGLDILTMIWFTPLKRITRLFLSVFYINTFSATVNMDVSKTAVQSARTAFRSVLHSNTDCMRKICMQKTDMELRSSWNLTMISSSGILKKR